MFFLILCSVAAFLTGAALGWTGRNIGALDDEARLKAMRVRVLEPSGRAVLDATVSQLLEYQRSFGGFTLGLDSPPSPPDPL